MLTFTAGFCLVALVASCTDTGIEPQVPNFNLGDFPHEVGTTWTYAVYDNILQKVETVVMTVSGKMSGESVWFWDVDYTGVKETAYCHIDGDTMIIYHQEDKSWINTTYVFPMQAGNRWDGATAGSESSVYKVGPEAVHAGSFESCFQIMESWGVNDDHTDFSSWLVPQVGIVRMNHTETQRGIVLKNVTWELLSYHVSR